MTLKEQYEFYCSVDSDIKQHLPTLFKYAKGQILEIGVRDGLSTTALLYGISINGGHLYSIDISETCRNRFGSTDWTFLCGHSKENAAEFFSVLPFLNVLFIDGDHSYEMASSDLITYGRLLKPGGVILMHDVELEGAGVMRAITEYHDLYGGTLEIISGCFGFGVLRFP